MNLGSRTLTGGAPRRRSTSSVVAGAAVALLLLPPTPLPLGAAQPASSDSFLETVDVEVVNVDVVVVDAKGNPVEGLGAADFEVFEDGERRELSNFHAFDDGRLVGDAMRRVGQQEAVPLEGTLVRRMAIVFDQNSLVKRDRDRAVDALIRFIEEQFDSTYEWAVVAYDSQLRMVQPFTSDKPRVISALHRVKEVGVPSQRRIGSNRTMLSEEPEQRFEGAAREIDSRGGGNVTLQDFEVRERMLENLHNLERMARSVVETMRAYANVSGRKSLVLVTGVLEALPTSEQLIGRGFPGASQEADRPDPVVPALHSEVQRLLGAMVQVANGSGFAVYPVSAVGFAAPQAPYLEIERKSSPFTDSFNQVPTGADTDTAPRVLADGTGGKYFVSNKYYEAFDEVDERTANSYVLGFQTTHQPDRKFHRIRVDVKRPGLRVQAREGYYHLATSDRIAQALSTPLSFEKERGEIPVQVAVKPPDTSARRPEYTLTVAGLMPLEEITLVPNGDRSSGRVQLYLAIYDDAGKLVDLVRANQDVHVTEEALHAEKPNKSASFAMRFKLKPGTYTVSLTMMDEVTTRYGTGFDRVRI